MFSDVTFSNVELDGAAAGELPVPSRNLVLMRWPDLDSSASACCGGRLAASNLAALMDVYWAPVPPTGAYRFVDDLKHVFPSYADLASPPKTQ